MVGAWKFNRRRCVDLGTSWRNTNYNDAALAIRAVGFYRGQRSVASRDEPCWRWVEHEYFRTRFKLARNGTPAMVASSS